MSIESTYRTGHVIIRHEDFSAERQQVRLIMGTSSAIFCLAGTSFISSLFARHLSMATEDLSVASILGIVGAILLMLASTVFCVGIRKNSQLNHRAFSQC